MSTIEYFQSLGFRRGNPVIAVNVRFPVETHARLTRLVGDLMASSGKKVSQNEIVVSLVSLGLDSYDKAKEHDRLEREIQREIEETERGKAA